MLPKASEGLKWDSLFTPEDDVLGEEVHDPARLEEISQNLAHLSSDKLVCYLPPSLFKSYRFPYKYMDYVYLCN